MKKKLFSLLICVALVLSIGVVAYAAAGGFTMTYLPGTADTVTNMPANDSGEGGTPYTVSSTVPQRDGYVFLGWKLAWEEAAPTYTLTYHVAGDPNYNNALPGDSVTPDPVADIAEGGSVTLANAPTTAWTWIDGTDPAAVKETYKVNYLEYQLHDGEHAVLAPEKVVTDQTIGITVTETAIDIDGYTVVGADTQDLTIRQSTTGQWTFTGWCSDEACTTPITEVTNITADMDVYGKWTYEVIDLANNEITFYYEKQTVQIVRYTVRYIDTETNELLCPDEVREGVERGTFVTEYAKEIYGYTPLYNEYPFEVEGDEVIVFLYYYDYGAPDNLMANAPMQATPSDAEPTPATPSDAKPTEAPVLTTEPNVKVPATASEPQETEPEPATKETPAPASEEVSKNDEEENVNEND